MHNRGWELWEQTHLKGALENEDLDNDIEKN